MEIESLRAMAGANQLQARHTGMTSARRSERLERRELLYAVVRESMTERRHAVEQLQVQGAVIGLSRAPVS